MSRIEHVQPGQTIKASTINTIIDAVREDSYVGIGNYRTTTSGVAVEPGAPLSYVDLGISPDAWKVDPFTLKVTNAWLTLGDKSYGACLTKQVDSIDGKDTVDYFHMIDFGKTAVESGEFQGDYYIRVSNSFADDPESVQTQEDADAQLFTDFYSDNTDQQNKVSHYYEIQVVKDDRKNGGETSLEDAHGVDTENCVYYKFFTIYGPHEGEKDEDGSQAKTLPPYDIHYYTRSFGGGFSSGSGLKPFALRWMPKSVEDDTVGEWQVYLPKGCMQLDNFVCWPKNEMGTDKDGTSTFQWYKIVDPNDSDADVNTSNGYAFKEWTVYAHVKEFPLFYVSSREEDTDFKTSTSIAIGTLTTKEWTDEAGKQHAMHSTTQIVGENIDRHTDDSGSFRITYKVQGDKKSEDSYHLLLTNQYITIGRNQIWIETDTDITSMTDVVLKIDHSTEDVAISIVDKLEKNTLDFTYIRILKLEDKSIVNDLRSEARVEFPFYNS